MKYKVFLFDADDTLFDFAAGEKLAFSGTVRELGYAGDLESVFATYKIESDSLWEQVEQGKLAKKELKWKRFHNTFQKHQMQQSSVAAGSPTDRFACRL